MDYLPGFKWAVSEAFSDAVYQCRFEEGDILYDNKEIYTYNWEKGSKFIEYYFQVQYPARTGGGPSEAGEGVFKNNWSSEVRIDLYKHLEKVSAGQIHTTQGRLYTILWKGNVSILNEPNEPPIPLLVRDVTKKIKQAIPKAKELSIGFPVFIMARDMSNPVSRDKYLSILSKLKIYLYNLPNILTPEKAGFVQFENIAPTIEIAFFPMKEVSAEELHDLVKSAVYIPSKEAKKEMFRIKAHGLIV